MMDALEANSSKFGGHLKLTDRAHDLCLSPTAMQVICDSATHAGTLDLPTQRQVARH